MLLSSCALIQRSKTKPNTMEEFIKLKSERISSQQKQITSTWIGWNKPAPATTITRQRVERINKIIVLAGGIVVRFGSFSVSMLSALNNEANISSFVLVVSLHFETIIKRSNVEWRSSLNFNPSSSLDDSLFNTPKNPISFRCAKNMLQIKVGCREGQH